MLFYLLYLFFSLFLIKNRLSNSQVVIIIFKVINWEWITLPLSNFYADYNIYHDLQINLHLIHHDIYLHSKISYVLVVKEIHF